MDCLIEDSLHLPARSRQEALTKRQALFQLTTGWMLIMAVIWSPRPYQQPLYVLAVLYLLGATWISFEGRQALGLQCRNFLRSAWVPVVALACAGLAVAAAVFEHTLHPVGGLSLYFKTFWGYALWSFFQQLLLQGFFLTRFCRLLRSPQSAAFASAGLFALAHLPNPILTVLTMIWGVIACLVFLRHRNVYPLAIAHAILGICVAVTLPGPVIRNMRVGLGWVNYPKTHDLVTGAMLPRPYRHKHG